MVRKKNKKIKKEENNKIKQKNKLILLVDRDSG